MLRGFSTKLAVNGKDNAGFRAVPLPAVALSLLTLGIILLWSHYQLLWTDEFYPLQNDSAATFSRVAQIQIHTPTSLDPLVYNVFAHEAINLFGVNKFSIRLPSFVGFLVMQWCLFFFVRRIAGERAATFAMALPALTCVLDYAVQARPNGLLLGLCALTMLSWQTATRKQHHRVAVLIVLAASIFATINTHYYGVLMLVPICGAELFRTFQRRRWDWPVVLSVLIGMTGVAALLPFLPALAAFRTHYYNTQVIVVQFISHSYIWMFMGDSGFSLRTQHVLAVAGLLFLALFVKSFLRYRKSGGLDLPPAELLFAVLFAALPVFGFLLTYFVTKVIEVRYIIPAVAGVAALIAILLASVLQKELVYRSVITLMFAAIAVTGYLHIRTVIREAAFTRAALVLAPQTKTGLEEYPRLPIYTINPAAYQIQGYYSLDADVRSRIALMYSKQQEIEKAHSNYLSMTCSNMKANGSPRVTTFESLQAEGGVHLMLLSHVPGDWTDAALRESHASIRSLGPMFGYDLSAVLFPDAQNPSAQSGQKR